MTLIYQNIITREDLRANSDAKYIFGDNLQRAGFGGQAKAMRGEPNAIGVATKYAPGMTEKCFFSDDDFDYLSSRIDADFKPAFVHAKRGGLVVFPLNGIGTGLSELPKRAPRLNAYIEFVIKDLASQ